MGDKLNLIAGQAAVYELEYAIMIVCSSEFTFVIYLYSSIGSSWFLLHC